MAQKEREKVEVTRWKLRSRFLCGNIFNTHFLKYMFMGNGRLTREWKTRVVNNSDGEKVEGNLGRMHF